MKTYEVNADKVFNLADRRMYRIKKEFHKSHGKLKEIKRNP